MNGRTLDSLSKEVYRQEKEKKDFLADTRQLSLETDPKTNQSLLQIRGADVFQVSNHMHDQLQARLGMGKYYTKLRQKYPGLLDHNVNELFTREPERRMIRTLGQNGRAYLSDRYRRHDNFALLQSVLPVLNEVKDLVVTSCEITETKLYLKLTLPSLQREVRVGDVVQAGVTISNSEIGVGAVDVAPFIWRLVCLNGMKINDLATKKRHVGGRYDEDAAVAEILSDETVNAEDKAFWLKVRDVVRAALTESRFEDIVERLKAATAQPVQDPLSTVKVLGTRYSLPEEEQDNILAFLLRDNDLTQYGTAQAITRFAQDAPSYDRSSDLEQIGGEVIDLTPSEWRVISQKRK